MYHYLWPACLPLFHLTQSGFNWYLNAPIAVSEQHRWNCTLVISDCPLANVRIFVMGLFLLTTISKSDVLCSTQVMYLCPLQIAITLSYSRYTFFWKFRVIFPASAFGKDYDDSLERQLLLYCSNSFNMDHHKLVY